MIVTDNRFFQDLSLTHIKRKILTTQRERTQRGQFSVFHSKTQNKYNRNVNSACLYVCVFPKVSMVMYILFTFLQKKTQTGDGGKQQHMLVLHSLKELRLWSGKL